MPVAVETVHLHLHRATTAAMAVMHPPKWKRHGLPMARMRAIDQAWSTAGRTSHRTPHLRAQTGPHHQTVRRHRPPRACRATSFRLARLSQKPRTPGDYRGRPWTAGGSAHRSGNCFPHPTDRAGSRRHTEIAVRRGSPAGLAVLELLDPSLAIRTSWFGCQVCPLRLSRWRREMRLRSRQTKLGTSRCFSLATTSTRPIRVSPNWDYSPANHYRQW